MTSDLYSIVVLAAQTTAEAMREWFFHRFLGNLDIVMILTAMRMWSQSEHRKTAHELKEARAQLASAVATTAAGAVAASSAQNAEILREVKINTEVSTKAFHEANSVNQKIAELRVDQNELRRDAAETKGEE